MAKDPNFVSVRLPDDVAIWLREYATANKMVRADKPNMGGSIIAVIRGVMSGQTISNNVGQSSAAPDVDIESMINEALNSKIKELREEFEEHESIIVARSQKVFEVQISTFREEMNEAIATAKKPLLSVMREKVIAA
ncbi:hypothetical protein [Phormidium tenue]|uniref:Uncharacterized protein n=1 Tax=Phormidium tenue FACHB-1050 TaxID=2692857 RepID=A0ABR8CGV5_9CYAN|nr:hypothetical protein [Phormidium tenue]MBD2319958.1 hypothetical protein [Phormidium tenue FACHB-1050]